MVRRSQAVALSAAIAFACTGLAPPGLPLLTDPPARSEASDADTCAFEAWVTDQDPNGLNVRARPSAKARIVGTLPPPRLDPELEMVTHSAVKVLESRHGWFRIGDPDRSRNLGGDPGGLKGWVYGRHLGFALQTDKAFARPDPGSRVVATAWRDGQGGHPLEFRHPHECRGEWVRLLVRGHDGPERLGWVRGTCAIEETTCDGVAGDLMKYEDMPAH